MIESVKLNLPSTTKVYNFLYDTKNTEYLFQDLLTVAINNTLMISVGWWPEHDPNGAYVASILQDENGIFEPVEKIETKNIQEVIDYVENNSKKLTKTYNKAKKIRRHYRKQIDELTIKIRGGDKQASIDIIRAMGDYNVALKEIGYRETCVDGEKPVLMLITKEWIKTQKEKEIEEDKWLKKIHNDAATAIRELVLLQQESYGKPN